MRTTQQLDTLKQTTFYVHLRLSTGNILLRLHSKLPPQLLVNTVLDHQPLPRPKADHEDLSWTEKQRVLWIQGAGRNILVFLLWPSFSYKLKMIWSGLEFLLRFPSQDYFWQRQDKRVISGWPGREVLICITAIVSLNFHPVHFQPAIRSWRLWDLEI